MGLSYSDKIGYVPLLVASLMALASLITLNIYLIVATSAIAISSFLILKLWYLLEDAIFKRSNFIQVVNGFELSGDRASAMCYVDGLYSATAAGVVEQFGDGKMENDKMESFISHIAAPFKIVFCSERLSVEGLLNRLKTQKGMKEIHLSRIRNQSGGSGMIAANRLRSEISILENEISNIESGGVPIKLSYYIMSVSLSESKLRAEETSKAQIREILSEFDAIFDAKSRVLSGNELINLMRFDSCMVIK
jgi:hypothetical protein